MFRPTTEMDNHPYVRPPTPQALLHRAPNKLGAVDTCLTRPQKYIIILVASTSVAGKVQIATSVSKSLSCPLFQGDSLHESSAKAAAVGANRSNDGGMGRYQRMWLSKMIRTGLLFPEESRPANEGAFGFGGESSSTSTSRRGSGSSISSTTSSGGGSKVGSTASSVIVAGTQSMAPGSKSGLSQYINRPLFTDSEEERLRNLNPALMVLTHPELEVRHRDTIRNTLGEYGIGVIFVPLSKIHADNDEDLEKEGDDELPVLRPLDPRTISEFQSFDTLRAAAGGTYGGKKLEYGKGREGNLGEEMLLKVDVGGSVEEIIEEVVGGVRNVMFAQE